MILKNFYNIAFDFIKNNKEQILDYAEQLKKQGGFNDFQLRLAFDCYYAHKHKKTREERSAGNQDFYFTDYICNICNLNKKQGIKDNYITTLYKKALIDCKIL